MKKTFTLFLALAATLVAAGCGADNATAADAAAYKTDKSAIKGPPPGANKAPSDFHSSLDSSAHMPGAASGAPKPSGG